MGREFPGVRRVTRSSVSSPGTNLRLLAQQVRALAAELERVYALLGEKYNPDGAISREVLMALSGNHPVELTNNQPHD